MVLTLSAVDLRDRGAGIRRGGWSENDAHVNSRSRPGLLQKERDVVEHLQRVSVSQMPVHRLHRLCVSKLIFFVARTSEFAYRVRKILTVEEIKIRVEIVLSRLNDRATPGIPCASDHIDLIVAGPIGFN